MSTQLEMTGWARWSTGKYARNLNLIMLTNGICTCPRKWHTQTLMGRWHTNGSLNLSQKTKPYNNQQKNKICKIVDFAVLRDNKIKLKECENRDKYIDFARELKKKLEHVGDNYTNCNWCFWHGNKRIIKGPVGFGSWRPSGDYPNSSTIEDCQNTEKSSGELRRLAVTQYPVKDHQLTLVWKTLMSK